VWAKNKYWKRSEIVAGCLILFPNCDKCVLKPKETNIQIQEDWKHGLCSRLIWINFWHTNKKPVKNSETPHKVLNIRWNRACCVFGLDGQKADWIISYICNEPAASEPKMLLWQKQQGRDTIQFGTKWWHVLGLPSNMELFKDGVMSWSAWLGHEVTASRNNNSKLQI